ncbi:MAG: radical SAM protein [Desulfobacteraceae bacterium]|jgi:wyosine [tRNA(Phe)-imidazoG37] synthetase (radical SAM superfamily)
MSEYSYLFGPVPSRRFGRSLGVDLTPYKTCSLDCVFCQLGKTTHKTVKRKEYVPTEDVISEIDAWLTSDGEADYITLSGSGEPTLHSRFGDVLAFLRERTSIPAVVLTNGTLLHLPEVRDAACRANVVKVSLSAWDNDSFGWVNRPHSSLRFDRVVDGQKAFRKQFQGELWMEVFLVAGMNSTPSDVKRIAAVAREIEPDRIQLNTVVRPPTEAFAEPLSMDQLLSLCPFFHPEATVIAEFHLEKDLKAQVNKETVLAMLKRRPCTAEQIAKVFNMHLNEVSKYIGNLLRTGQVRAERRNRSIYYSARREKTEPGSPA